MPNVIPNNCSSRHLWTVLCFAFSLWTRDAANNGAAEGGGGKKPSSTVKNVAKKKQSSSMVNSSGRTKDTHGIVFLEAFSGAQRRFDWKQGESESESESESKVNV